MKKALWFLLACAVFGCSGSRPGGSLDASALLDGGAPHDGGAIALVDADSGSTAAPDAEAPDASGDAGRGVERLWAWVGQSNAGEEAATKTMSGADLGLLTPNPAVWYCTHELSSPGPTPNIVIDMPWGPLRADTLWPPPAAPSRNGMELAFGRAMGAGNAVAKWLVGGSQLQNWVWYDRWNVAGKYFVEQMKKRGRPQTVAGIVFIQGESETAATVGAWEANAVAGVAILRSYLGPAPVIIVLTHSSLAKPGLRAAQLSFAAQEHAAVVNADAFKPENPPHWDNPSVDRIGELIAAAAQSLRQ